MSVHAPTSPDRDPPPKATLFCPDCGHEAPATGDWVVRNDPGSDRASDGDAVVSCPDCEAEIAIRGRSELAPLA
jgi:DNA-directed RNA polymerase subunit RPC12/RpoP